VAGAWGLAGLALSLVLVPPTPSVAAPVPGDPCPNGDVRAAQREFNGIELLDCMALEQVSPVGKFSQPAKVYQPVLEGGISPAVYGGISPDGERLLFVSPGSLADTPAMLRVSGDPYVATREVERLAWATSATSPTDPQLLHGENGVAHPSNLSADLSQWFQLTGTAAEVELGVLRVMGGGIGRSSTPRSPRLEPLSGLGMTSPPPRYLATHARATGASADHSRFYFRPGAVSVFGGGASEVTYLQGDPVPAGTLAISNTYVSGLDGGEPALWLLARDGDGRVWGGRCGASVAGADGLRSQGAISADGSRTYFTTRPAQAFDSGVGDNPACSAASKQRIMVRRETSAGVVIEELFESECDRVADLPTTPACNAAGPLGTPLSDSDDTYRGASMSGDRVYFTTARQLADSDTNGLDQFGFPGGCTASFAAGCDLYVYDETEPEGERLIQVTASGSGRATPAVVALSGDGSRVYFTSSEVLTESLGPGGQQAVLGSTNLYMWDADERSVSFIGVTGEASSFWPVPVMGGDPTGPNVGGDGRRLVFTSNQPLTSDDSDGAATDVFRYDAIEHELERISKAAPGGSDGGPAGVVTGEGLGSYVVSGDNNPAAPDFAVRGRWVSEDAETIAFSTADGLLPEDDNGVMDSYLWRDGDLTLLPGTADGADKLRVRPLVSFDGETVAFHTFERLLPGDQDSAMDVYVLRVNGGFPFSQPLAEDCDVAAGSCQRGGAGAADVAVGTTSGADANAAAVPRRRLALARPSARARRLAVRRGILALRVRSNRAGVVRVVARRLRRTHSRRVGGVSQRFGRPGMRVVRLRLNRRVKRQLALGQGVRMLIEARMPGARTRSLTVVLRGKGRS
jgi:hypothetical protein